MLTGEYNILIDNMWLTDIISFMLLLLPIIFLCFHIKWLLGLYAVSIVANLPLIFFMSFNFSYELIITFMLGIKIIINVFKEKSIKYITTKENLYLFFSLLLIIVVNLVTSLFNLNHKEYLIRSVIYLVNIFIFFTFTYYINEPNRIEDIKNAIIVGAMILAVSMIAEMVYGYYVLEVANMRPAGLLLDPNVSAFTLNISLIISFFKSKNITFLKAVIYSMFRILTIFSIFLTVSRSGYIALIIILFFLLFYYSQKDTNWLPVTIVSVFIFIYFLFFKTSIKFWETIHGIIDLKRIFPFNKGSFPSGDGPSEPSASILDNERIILIITALRIFINNIFVGVGIGNVIPKISAYTGIRLNTHNLMLQLLAESGFLILVAFVLFGYYLFHLLKKAAVEIRWFLILIFIVVAFESLFNHNLLNLNFIWLIFSFVLAGNVIYSENKKTFSIRILRNRQG
ncbi:MAG: O-antigen ligase family protein [Bacilli bacterium]|nr:O-antigen ligase family protein [Bacilli bacterium]MDD4076487.1 O-antigen ligase family protein [Bacilli bacterium]MDD4387762.1 O-antigen ligase family protein [Bacilli bacterium]